MKRSIILNEQDFERLLKRIPLKEYKEIDDDDDIQDGEGNYFQISLIDPLYIIRQEDEDAFNALVNIINKRKANEVLRVYTDGGQITDDSEVQAALKKLPDEIREIVQYYVYEDIYDRINKDIENYPEDDIYGDEDDYYIDDNDDKGYWLQR